MDAVATGQLSDHTASASASRQRLKDRRAQCLLPPIPGEPLSPSTGQLTHAYRMHLDALTWEGSWHLQVPQSLQGLLGR